MRLLTRRDILKATAVAVPLVVLSGIRGEPVAGKPGRTGRKLGHSRLTASPRPPSDAPLEGFFIRANGNDTTGAGTEASPWLTVAKFLAVPPVAGDTLYVMDTGGEFAPNAGNRNNYMPTTPPAGSAGNPITIRNYPGHSPVFEGGAGTTLTDRHFITFRNGSHYWTLDGLAIQGYLQGSYGIVQIGQGGTQADNITIRNCSINVSSPLAGTTEHAIYLEYGDDATIEDNDLRGPLDARADSGAGIHIYQDGGVKTAHDAIFRRNIMHRWHRAIMFWTTLGDGTIEWNTFHNNGQYHADLNRHGLLLFRNNVGELGIELQHENEDPGDTTANNNYGASPQTSPGTLNADGSLQAGSAAIDGAHDGSDAGAIPYP